MMASKQKWTVSIVLLALLFATLSLFYPHRTPDPNSRSGDPVPSNVSSSATPPSDARAIADSPTSSPISAVEAVHRATLEKNVPINFWGKIVDQNDLPLPNVAIRAKARQWGMALPAEGTFKIINLESGIDGKFSITGELGDLLTIEQILKPGYELSRKARRDFGYNLSENITPDSNGPILFKMWKKVPPQALRTSELSRIGIPCDGTAKFFDLEKGETVVSGGQIKVIFVRDPVVLPPGNTRFDWHARVEMTSGGIQLANDEFGYLAPESGYESILQFDANKEDPTWTSILEKDFYFVTGQGKYGRVHFRLRTNYQAPPTGLTLDIVSNPSGSRSLQP
jgi:hypothetical protein